MSKRHFYSESETAELLSMSAEQVKVLERDGRLRAFRDGGQIRYKAEEVDDIVKAMNLVHKFATPEMAAVTDFFRGKKGVEMPTRDYWKDIGQKAKSHEIASKDGPELLYRACLMIEEFYKDIEEISQDMKELRQGWADLNGEMLKRLNKAIFCGKNTS